MVVRRRGVDSCLRRNDGGVRVPGMWGSAVSAPLRPGHTPLTSFAPPYAKAKGATRTRRGVDSCLRRNDGWGSRNDGGVGFRGCGDRRCLPRSAPGIPRSLRSRPFRRGRKGQSECAVPHPPRASPAHIAPLVRAPLRWSEGGKVGDQCAML